MRTTKTYEMNLAALLESSGLAGDVAGGVPAGAQDVTVRSVEFDSRRVSADALFVAVPGFVADGHDFVAAATERGAVAALVERATDTPGVLEIVVPDTRSAMGPVAHELYGRPTDRLVVHGLTGTNGKTTTSHIVDAILRQAGQRTGLIGTLGYRIADTFVPATRTSPEAVDLARALAEMDEAGVESVTMEVSSHALALGRALGTRFDTATFTNLSRDHLDFHGSLEEYGAAKRRLFELAETDANKPGSTAVINTDDPFGRDLADAFAGSATLRVITYGMDGGDVHATDVRASASGTTARFHTPAGAFDVSMRLIAGFNVMNALAATAVAVSRAIPLATIQAGIASVERVAGRLEVVPGSGGFSVVVDYAHTPDALEKVLKAVRGLDPRHVVTVFGCGGDRDRGKRPLMGEIAVRLSDRVVVTSDNPRTENPAAIIEEILEGIGDIGRSQIDVIEDRRDAIRTAVSMAGEGDVVVIAGKGHEDYQIIGTEKVHFDDREEAMAAMADASASDAGTGPGTGSGGAAPDSCGTMEM